MKKKSWVANKILTDSKHKKIFNKLKLILSKSIGRSKFAVGVSGGADSLSLTFLAYIYSKQFKSEEIIFLIVDHNLRKNSRKEALKVRKLLKEKGLTAKILTWKGKVPKKNIQFNARKIRYDLISNFCKKKRIKYLVTAHHNDDQLENFFIRILRGSGLSGLSSMSYKVQLKQHNNLSIVRPLLDFKKDDLKLITKKAFGYFIDDPSNFNDVFLRIRVRKLINLLQREGLNFEKINKTINHLSKAKRSQDFYVKESIKKYVMKIGKNKIVLDISLFNSESSDVIFKSFSEILQMLSGSYYPPRSKKIISLISKIHSSNFKKSTLGHCVIEKMSNLLIITKERLRIS